MALCFVGSGDDAEEDDGGDAITTRRVAVGGAPVQDARAFLADYRRVIERLPLPIRVSDAPISGIEKYIAKLSPTERKVFATIVPTMASCKEGESLFGTIAATYAFCLWELSAVIKAWR
jgi:hypothetical protein